jgi:hypothetical protein
MGSVPSAFAPRSVFDCAWCGYRAAARGGRIHDIQDAVIEAINDAGGSLIGRDFDYVHCPRADGQIHQQLCGTNQHVCRPRHFGSGGRRPAFSRQDSTPPHVIVLGGYADGDRSPCFKQRLAVHASPDCLPTTIVEETDHCCEVPPLRLLAHASRPDSRGPYWRSRVS